MKKIKKFFRVIKNYFFCKKYPFWKITDSWYCYNTRIDDNRIGSKDPFVIYDRTWYDDIPTGWKKAFGKKLSKEIKNTGLKLLKENKDLKWSDLVTFQQIKEKWGKLCLYASAHPAISFILDKYEYMSSGYCISCGKPARYMSKGWISFFCKKCYKKYLHRYDDYDDEPLTKEKEAQLLEQDRLTKDDIIHSYEYVNGEKHEIDLKEKYGVDFEELYGLK